MESHCSEGEGDGDGDSNGAASSHSQPPAEETTPAKRLRLTTTATTTLTQQTLNPSQPQLPPPPATIPFDLAPEILVRLPVKPLLRFRSVCKSWDALISDPQFAKDQFLRSSAIDPTHSTRNRLITFEQAQYDDVYTNYSLPSSFNGGSFISATKREFPYGKARKMGDCRILEYLRGSCHGMLCIIADGHRPLLLNPCTGKFKTLPDIDLKPPPWVDLIRYMRHGFGYDHLSDSYKVVAVSEYRDRVTETAVMVHTLGTDTWRAIEPFPVRESNLWRWTEGCRAHEFNPCCPHRDCSGKFVSGTLNWLVADYTNVIVSLDLGTETYQQLLPPVVRDNKHPILGVLNGCLSIATCDKAGSDVWVMKDYGKEESWTKVFSVPSYYSSYPAVKALCICGEDEEILMKSDMFLFVYNRKSDTVVSIAGSTFGMLIAHVYSESLISPCS